MPNNDKHTENSDNSEWFVRINDGDIYGPVDLTTLQQWSEQGRIEPENEISKDQENWIAAEELPELEMDWLTELEDESIFGPFNIHLAPELISRGVLSENTILKNRKTGEIHPIKPNNDDEPYPSSDIKPPAKSEQVTKVVDVVHDEEPQTPTPITESKTTITSQLAETQLPSDKHKDPIDNSDSDTNSQKSKIVSIESDPLAELRKDLTKERAKSTVLQDDILRLQDELNVSQNEKEASNNRLFEEQARLNESQSEVENLTAQINQLQEHYDRLQEESKNQFEELDQLRAESMELEQEYQKKVTSEADRASSKTAILAQTLKLIYQDKDLKVGNIPKNIINEPNSEHNKELQMRVSHLQQQVEEERKHAQQIDKLLKSSSTNHPKNIIVVFLLAIVFILTIILALIIWKSNSDGINANIQSGNNLRPESGSALTISNTSVAKPTTSKKQQHVTKGSTTKRHTSPPVSTNLDLPPENNSTPIKISNKTDVTWPSIKMPRCIIKYNNNACRIQFTYGLFSKSTTITPEAKLDLAKLAKQLNGNIKGFTIIAEGHTDSTPISSPIAKHIDNYALAMDRAETIKSFLETQCNIPEGIIRTASAGESDPPYPNDTTESRRKNRTVVLTLIPPPK